MAKIWHGSLKSWMPFTKEDYEEAMIETDPIGGKENEQGKGV